MDAIRKYFDLNKKDCYQRINEETASDLNLDELFSEIDYTESPIGKQILYDTLRTIPTENSIIKDNEKWIDHYSKEDNVKEKVSKTLSKLDKFDSYFVYSLITENHVPFSKKQIYLFRVLQVLPSIFLISLIVLKSWIFILGLFVSYLINLYIHYSSKSKLFAYSGSIPMLRQIMNACRSLNKNTEFQCELIKNSEIKDAIHSTKEVYRNLSNYRFWVILDSDITMIIWAITELLRAFFLSEVFNLHSIFKQISRHRKSLICIFEFVGLIDTLSSIDKMRKASKNYCIPIFDNKSLATDLQDIYHPLIENCISNSLSLSEDSYLILGSNMSGKTSFIRTVGINILLAQTINTCFAKQATLHKQRIYSVIAINDNIMKGQSYYLSEVLKIKDLLYNTEQGSNLILLDELFKGTNTIERVAAAKAVLKYLLKNKANRILVATHDFELMELLNNDYSQIFFEENITNNKLSFDYKISFNPTGKRNAIKILELYEFPKEVVDDALTTIPNKL